MSQNTTYIETTMGKDVGSNEDGRHRFMNSPAFTVGGNPDDPVIGTGMDGVLYLRKVSVDAPEIQGFYRNAEGIYQYIPTKLSGSVAVSSTSTFVTVVAVPKNVYGEIFMYTTAQGASSTVTGFFRSNATKVEAWSILNKIEGSGTAYALEFANGSNASGLNIRARRGDGANATYNYIITYRTL
jgi:hypothetical protein